MRIKMLFTKLFKRKNKKRKFISYEEGEAVFGSRNWRYP